MRPTTQCQEMELLIQADIDGELSAADAAAVIAHTASCAQCMRVYSELRVLQRSIRQGLMRSMPSADFRAMLEAKIALDIKSQSVSLHPGVSATSRMRWRVIPAFGTGAVLAASLMFILLTPAEPMLADAVVAGYIRALQPGHLLDVVSNDQHNVKPWFEGRLDFSPPVKNFAELGFPLEGGRLDYLQGRAVAALIYRRGKHPINVFIWPDSDRITWRDASTIAVRNGYHIGHWVQGGMVFWAVSDLNEAELSKFIQLWKDTML